MLPYMIITEYINWQHYVSCKSILRCRHYQSHKKRVVFIFFKYKQYDRNCYTGRLCSMWAYEIEWCSYFRVAFWGQKDFLSAFTARQGTPGSLGPFYPRLTQLILRIVDVIITCQFLIMSAHPPQTFLSFWGLLAGTKQSSIVYMYKVFNVWSELGSLSVNSRRTN